MLLHAAYCRLLRSMSRVQKRRMVESVLRVLGLEDVQHSPIGHEKLI